MPRTKVINLSNNTIILKEGNAGIFNELATLRKGESMDLSISPNATYREYWFAAVDSGSAGHKVILTSDDCLDSKEVRIVVVDNKIRWISMARPKSEHGLKSKGSFFSWIWPFRRYLSNLVSCL